jgi:hypothetical protein
MEAGMSFRCSHCNVQVFGSPDMVITGVRTKVYPPRPEAGDKGGKGWEISGEEPYCPKCAEGVVHGRQPGAVEGVSGQTLRHKDLG